MKMDYELFRTMLLDIEERLGPMQVYFIDRGEQAAELLPNTVKVADHPTVIEHLRLAIEGGYLRGKISQTFNPEDSGGSISGLTLEGHEFINNARNDKLWRKAMRTAGNASLTVLTAVLSDLIRKATLGQ